MKFKKIAVLIMTAVTAFSSLTAMSAFAEVTAENENQFSDGMVVYEKIKNGVKVVKCDSSLMELKISDKANGYDVIEIGEKAFYKASKLKTITIQGNVKSIGKNAFAGINKKAVIKIKASNSNYKKIVKLIKKSGAPKTVTYKLVK